MTNKIGPQIAFRRRKKRKAGSPQPQHTANEKPHFSQRTREMGHPANANGLNQSTTQQSETQWLLQSLVDQSNITGLGATPTFSYPSTAMSAWLCRSVQANPNYACSANNNNNYNCCPNNSSPQGQLFYQNILSGSAPPHFAVYAVDNCGNAEGVGSGTVPGFYPLDFGGTSSGGGNPGGIAAITDDMIGYVSGTTQIPAQCIHRIHTQ